jgi:hypothetical protein
MERKDHIVSDGEPETRQYTHSTLEVSSVELDLLSRCVDGMRYLAPLTQEDRDAARDLFDMLHAPIGMYVELDSDGKVVEDIQPN